MFASLGDNLLNIFKRIKQKGIISIDDLNIALREIRLSMIEADVSLSVIKEFINNVKSQALGQKIINSITPSQMIIKIVYDQLKSILGGSFQDIKFESKPPTVMMLVGLQGVGKTTTTVKLGLHLRKKYKKNVLLASLDTSRPAAQNQLKVLSQQISISSLSIGTERFAVDIAKRALVEAKEKGYDVLILDTAGRLHTNDSLMQEITNIKNTCYPIEILLIADSMSGQDAVNSAKHFHNTIGLTGTILTKIDGDARGGAALSIKYVTKSPIKFISYGEKISDFEKFHPDRIASRILDMGDIVTLVEKTMHNVSEEEAQKWAKRIERGNFNMEDLRKQLKQLKKLGGLSSIISMIPGFKQLKQSLGSQHLDPKILVRQEAIIDSMTKIERLSPQIINASRKNRIANGAGVRVQDVNKLIKQFFEIKKTMKQLQKVDKNNFKKFESILSNRFK